MHALRDAAKRPPQNEADKASRPPPAKNLPLGLLTRSAFLDYIPPHPTRRGASSGDEPKMGWEAAPAGGARNPAPGRPRANRPPALRPAAPDWGWTLAEDERRREPPGWEVPKALPVMPPGRSVPGDLRRTPQAERREARLRTALAKAGRLKRLGRPRRPLRRVRSPPRFPALRSPRFYWGDARRLSPGRSRTGAAEHWLFDIRIRKRKRAPRERIVRRERQRIARRERASRCETYSPNTRAKHALNSVLPVKPLQALVTERAWMSPRKQGCQAFCLQFS